MSSSESPNPELRPSEGGETWIECRDCGWNLGVAHLSDGFVPEPDLKAGGECPACGEPLHEVMPVSEHHAQLSELVERFDDRRSYLLASMSGLDDPDPKTEREDYRLYTKSCETHYAARRVQELIDKGEANG